MLFRKSDKELERKLAKLKAERESAEYRDSLRKQIKGEKVRITKAKFGEFDGLKKAMQKVGTDVKKMLDNAAKNEQKRDKEVKKNAMW